MLPCVSRRGPYSPDDLQHLSEQVIEDTMSDETELNNDKHRPGETYNTQLADSSLGHVAMCLSPRTIPN